MEEESHTFASKLRPEGRLWVPMMWRKCQSWSRRTRETAQVRSQVKQTVGWSAGDMRCYRGIVVIGRARSGRARREDRQHHKASSKLASIYPYPENPEQPHSLHGKGGMDVSVLTRVYMREAEKGQEPVKERAHGGQWVVVVFWSKGDEVKGEVEVVLGNLNPRDSRMVSMWGKQTSRWQEWLHLKIHGDHSYNPRHWEPWQEEHEFTSSLDHRASSSKPRPLYRKILPQKNKGGLGMRVQDFNPGAPETGRSLWVASQHGLQDTETSRPTKAMQRDSASERSKEKKHTNKQRKMIQFNTQNI